jgi:hypothetical protein
VTGFGPARRDSVARFAAVALALALAPRHDAAAGERGPELRLNVDLRLEAAPLVATLTDGYRLALATADEILSSAGGSRLTTTFSARLARFVAVDLAAASYAGLLAHEVLGHGARLRELGYDPAYDVSAPLPYALVGGGFGGVTHFDPGDLRPPSVDEQALIWLGGFEAEDLQVRHVAFTAFRARLLTRADSLLVLAHRAHRIETALRDRGDWRRFHELLGARTGADEARERRASQLGVAATLVDPLVIAALYAYVAGWLGRGADAAAYPAVRVGDALVTVANDLVLTPWGREHRLGVLVGAPFGDAAAGLRIGEGPGGSSLGVDVEAMDIPISSRLSGAFGLELYAQPALLVADRSFDPPRPIGPLTGGAVGDGARLRGVAASAGCDVLFDRWLLGARVGAKDVGYLLGQPYAARWTATLSIGLRAGR